MIILKQHLFDEYLQQGYITFEYGKYWTRLGVEVIGDEMQEKKEDENGKQD